MIRVLTCISEQHDWRLVAVAVLMCAFASITAVSIASRAQAAAGRARLLWLVLGGFCAGTGVWITHFIAMRAYESEVPSHIWLSYTAASWLIAVVFSGVAFAAHVNARGRFAGVLAGLIFAFAVSAMHFTGMFAYAAGAMLVWSYPYVAASIGVGSAISIAMFSRPQRCAELGGMIVFATLMLLAICATHFTAMAALTMIPREMPATDNLLLDTGALNVVIGGVSLLVVVAGFVAALVDRRLAEQRAQKEARLFTEQLQIEKQRAEAANIAKSEFLATMSHEIRTPMNGVIGMTEALYGTELTARQREIADALAISSTALLAIIDDILDFSKIEAGRFEIHNAAFNLRQTIEDAAMLFAGRAEQNGVALSVRYAATAPERVVGDAGRVRRIVSNFVSNAVKFTAAGHIRIDVAPSPAGRGVRISVEDSGVGIRADKLAAVFEKFTQADMSSTRRHQGAGLGLAITKRLAELMGGEVGVESVFGVGSTFWADLPLPVDNAAPGPAPAPERIEAAPQTPAWRVLLAEDNTVNQLVARSLLSDEPIAMEIVGDGAAAIEAWRSAPPHVILMDVSMPVMDGLEATRRIRELEAQSGARRTPIIAVTANALAEDRQRCLDAGMDDYLPKPINAAALKRTLRSWFLSHRTESIAAAG